MRKVLEPFALDALETQCLERAGDLSEVSVSECCGEDLNLGQFTDAHSPAAFFNTSDVRLTIFLV